MKITVNNIQEAVEEIKNQIKDSSNYLHNYRLLESVKEYLDNCIDKDDEDFDEHEQIFNHLAYDWKWSDDDIELFPMSL